MQAPSHKQIFASKSRDNTECVSFKNARASCLSIAMMDTATDLFDGKYFDANIFYDGRVNAVATMFLKI